MAVTGSLQTGHALVHWQLHKEMWWRNSKTVQQF